MAGKSNAVKCQWGGYTFDSKFELLVYQILTDFYLPCEISVHHPVVIATANEFMKNPWTHKVDFYIAKDNWYIEAKGYRFPEWKVLVKALCAMQHPILKRYTCVMQEENIMITPKNFSITAGMLRSKLQKRRFAQLMAEEKDS
jgi:hypothetical protein